jgi:hypothetical protein
MDQGKINYKNISGTDVLIVCSISCLVYPNLMVRKI